ncbi:NAD(P)-binding protein [Daedalea quercina L-15889]|uniref:NAD(P)-binding protein n=1 Tax=Daedalea quercina L-15889 TaxID=1314783 RepID=A0A165U717_9APHY|nr:NAD(P)-binding protein [Daedalea quercina L-15889]
MRLPPGSAIEHKIWFITGASSGFGRLMAELALRSGDLTHSSDKLRVLKIDVTRPQEIKYGFSEAINHPPQWTACSQFGRVDIVFNNAGYAGYAQIGEVEGVPENEAVRVLRDINKPAGGTLLQLSSSAGIKAYSAIGYYSAVKHAPEGISTALAVELDPEWNIKVEPGNFTTSSASNAVDVPPHPVYTKPTNPAAMLRKDAGKAVQAMYGIAQIPDPPLQFLLGKDVIQWVRGQIAEILADTD